jgi:hypothetical protein
LDHRHDIDDGGFNNSIPHKKMTIEDLKIYGLNSSVMAISFTQLEMALKIILLVATIIYTVHKTVTNIKQNKRNKKK